MSIPVPHGPHAPFAARAVALALVILLTLGGGASAASLGNVADNVRSVKKKVAVLPDKPAVRNLAKKVDPAVVGKVMDAVSGAQDALDLIEEQRQGFEQFKNGGGADTLRWDLKDLFEDVKTLHETAQRLRCFQDPDVSLVALNIDFVTKAVDHIPAVALYGMRKALDEVEPDWRTKVSDLNDALPVEEVGAVCEAGSDARAEYERLRCVVLRNINQTRLSRVQTLAVVASRLFGVIKEYAPTQISFQVAIVAVGGGGGGTSVDLPLKGMFETLISVLDGVAERTEQVQTQQQACFDADEKIERDLLSCAALASYDADLEPVRDLALRRMESLDASYGEKSDVEYAGSFGEICTAYREFRVQ